MNYLWRSDPISCQNKYDSDYRTVAGHVPNDCLHPTEIPPNYAVNSHCHHRNLFTAHYLYKTVIYTKIK